MTIVVTGADGFIGSRACESLTAHGYDVLRIVRHADGPGHMRHVVSDLTQLTDWRPLLTGAQAVVHLAGRAHTMRVASDEESSFRLVNVELTRRLAQQAVDMGVRRLVFVSTIGVNGATTDLRPFEETDDPHPASPYAKSKLAAEQELLKIASETALEVVIVRPPLVYGPGAKGNVLRLLRLVASGLPLPLGSLRNRRNVLGLDNLCDALVLCVESPAAAGETFLLAEPEVRSTPEIIAAIYAGMGRRSRLFQCPIALLRSVALSVGARSTFEKLSCSLEVSATKAVQMLGWSPQQSFFECLARTARWYVEQNQ